MTELDKGAIYIFNSRNRKKEQFVPVREKKVAMYTCGPTVYNYIHIGNARPLIVFDVIRKYFEYCGYEVKYVQNITDIDDRIIKKAIEEKTSTNEIANRFTKAFFDNCKSLGTKKPDFSPKATDYVDEMISLINDLVKNDAAYEAKGNIFFDVSNDSQYGSFSGKDLGSMELGDRVDDEITRIKKNQGDFSLWKPAKPGEPSWDSPWGKGRPGWHTECVVMSAKLLGGEFDIHTGGVDLLFPHHENEIAQARCSGNPHFAKYWMHNEFVNIKEKKMAKSEGNVVLVNDLVKKYRKEAIRLFFLQTHYRKPISFSEEDLDSCQSAIEDRKYYYSEINKAYDMIKDECKKNLPEKPKWYSERLIEIHKAMNDDFNTAVAVASFLQIVRLTLEGTREINSGQSLTNHMSSVYFGKKIIDLLNRFLCILPDEEKKDSIINPELKSKVEKLVGERTECRNNKEWEKADKIRDELMALGILIEDSKDGTQWWSKK